MGSRGHEPPRGVHGGHKMAKCLSKNLKTSASIHESHMYTIAIFM